MSASRKRQQICPYCCIRPGVTADHIIASCLFPKPIPNGINLPTVRACADCNNEKKSKDDTYLRDFLVMQFDCVDQPSAQSVFRGPLSRAVVRNQSEFMRSLGDFSVWLPEEPQPDLTVVPAVVKSIDVKRLHQALAKIVRGLYLKQSHHILPRDAIFQWAMVSVQKASEIMRTPGVTWRITPHLGDVFSCMYLPGPIETCRSFWMMGVYDRVCFLVWTFKTIDEAEKNGLHSLTTVIVPPLFER